MEALTNLITPWLSFLSADPNVLMLQSSLMFIGVIVVFLVFFTTRDILLRTNSFWYMLFSIVLTAVLPVVGFCIYLLIRPTQTLKEREMEEMLRQLTTDKKLAKKPSSKKAKKPTSSSH